MISVHNGIDICLIERISKLYDKFGERFLKKILSTKEQKEFKQKYSRINLNYLAKRFAAKEAFSKAIGEGIGNISFRDIEIIKDHKGSPEIKLSNKAIDYLRINKKWLEYDISLSMSDDGGLAIASVVILLLRVN